MTSISGGDNIQQEEEILALQAIYAEAFTATSEGRLKVCIPSAEAPSRVVVSVYLPETYPSSSPPVVELHGSAISADQQAEAIQHLDEIFQPGEVVLFELLAWLQEQEQYWRAEDAPDESCVPELLCEHFNVPTPEATAAQAPCCDEIWSIITSGSPFTEKKSVFQAHLAPVKSTDEVEKVITTLLTNGKIQRATHNIMAYRIAVLDKETFLQDYDDDGESAAGGRLLRLLTLVGAENVVVVVSRWFGGVLLGPARFTHINNAARQLLDQCGYIRTGAKQGKPARRAR
ncbi:hypothetical protein CVIRNUC_005766 [Coccomyxa viridis]|uniref:RWD domain-containing protein n=1 Tax=Coccomyxa viridis TaxID=1274662 RepID=A0AAV1I711_9CHLO|nr:hypothetical protein CVIRNUC_005766 [Coccomyxa viridis]